MSTNNYDDFCIVVAKQIQDQLNKKANSHIALPAGHSPCGYYNILAQASQSNEIDWRQAQCFALDDYIGAQEEHSFQYFLESHLYRFTNLPVNARFNPRNCDNYDQLIQDRGGIDLCVLGLGVNGHIAFNEPPTTNSSYTHCVFLTNSTREANKDEFVPANSVNLSNTIGSGNDSAYLDAVPNKAVTMGIATIMASKRIILAVSGKHKKEILIRTLKNPANAQCPASYLTSHSDLLVVTDFEFAI